MKFKWFRDESEADLDAYLLTLKLMEWTQPEGKIQTEEEFARIFSRNLVGSWTNEPGMMPSPMAKDVEFRKDGTGYVEGAFFTQYSGNFEWREKEEHLIEVRNVGESEAWFPLSWEIWGNKSIWLASGESGPEEGSSAEPSPLIESFLYDPLVLCDSRAWNQREVYNPVPNDADEIAVGGQDARVWKGATYRKLRQGPYEVTVANAEKEGKPSHFFSFYFVAPRTGKQFTGYYDHAPGHIDRERFLHVAGRIASGLRRVYG